MIKTYTYKCTDKVCDMGCVITSTLDAEEYGFKLMRCNWFPSNVTFRKVKEVKEEIDNEENV